MCKQEDREKIVKNRKKLQKIKNQLNQREKPAKCIKTKNRIIMENSTSVVEAQTKLETQHLVTREVFNKFSTNVMRTLEKMNQTIRNMRASGSNCSPAQQNYSSTPEIGKPSFERQNTPVNAQAKHTQYFNQTPRNLINARSFHATKIETKNEAYRNYNKYQRKVDPTFASENGRATDATVKI